MKPVLIVVLFAWVTSIASASCGSATCPLDNHRYMLSGRLHIMAAYEYINQDRIYVGSSPSYVGALPNTHDEVQTINQRGFVLGQYGLSDRLALQFELPFVHREHSHIENGVTDNFNFSGLGDVIVGGQYAFLTAYDAFEPSLSLRFGAKLPTGATDATSTAGEPAEVTIQPGTGSFDAIVGLNYRQDLVSVPMFSGEYATVPFSIGVSYSANGKGTNGYRVGNTLLVSLGTEYQMLDRLGLLLQVNGMVRDHADVGTTGELPENTGGTWIFASPGLNLRLNDALSLFGYVQLPVYINVHGIQQASRFNLQVGVSVDMAVVEGGGND